MTAAAVLPTDYGPLVHELHRRAKGWLWLLSV
jgi:hypothetical protein